MGGKTSSPLPFFGYYEIVTNAGGYPDFTHSSQAGWREGIPPDFQGRRAVSPVGPARPECFIILFVDLSGR